MRSGRQLLAQANQASWRTFSFFAGFGLLCAAQWLMARGSPLFGQAGWGEWLNKRYHLDIAYADNALLAVGLLLIGSGLCAYGLMGGVATRLPDDCPDPVPPVHGAGLAGYVYHQRLWRDGAGRPGGQLVASPQACRNRRHSLDSIWLAGAQWAAELLW